MDKSLKIAVCSRSFSANPQLRKELQERYAQVKYNEEGKNLADASLVSFLREADRAIIGLEYISEEILQSLPKLRVIGKYGVGLDKLDFAAMDKHKVQLGWTPGVNAQAVAELTLGLALNIIRKIHISRDSVLKGEWSQIKGRQISSLSFGILGCGHVGKALAKLLKPFGGRILACDILDQNDFYKTHGVEAMSFQELLQRSDVLSLHIPKNSTTTGIINARTLAQMKDQAFLLNTARGGLVEEDAVLKALDSGKLAAAAFDVLAEEPPCNRLLAQHPRAFVTSHIAGSSEEAILAMGRAAIQGLETFGPAGAYERYR